MSKKNICSVSLATILSIAMVTYYVPAAAAVTSASIAFTDKRGPGTLNPNGQIDVGNGGGYDDSFVISWTRQPSKDVYLKINDVTQGPMAGNSWGEEYASIGWGFKLGTNRIEVWDDYLRFEKYFPILCEPGATITFTFTGGVGGIVIPIDKFGLLAPYIGLASTILVATVATVIYVKRVKGRKEKQ